MNLDDRLNAALIALQLALPDPAAWFGPAATSFEHRLREQQALLLSTRAGLWQ